MKIQNDNYTVGSVHTLVEVTTAGGGTYMTLAGSLTDRDGRIVRRGALGSCNNVSQTAMGLVRVDSAAGRWATVSRVRESDAPAGFDNDAGSPHLF